MLWNNGTHKLWPSSLIVNGLLPGQCIPWNAHRVSHATLMIRKGTILQGAGNFAFVIEHRKKYGASRLAASLRQMQTLNVA